MKVALTTAAPCGPFEFRWPQVTEAFSGGWEGQALVDGRRFSFRHGLGGREVYGKQRPHTVTFLNGDASVEGVASDDYEASRALLSLIKPGRGHRLAREPSDVPDEYAGFELVDHRAEIDAPYSKRCLALKIREDDLERWVLHAARRAYAQGR